mmetsp:Transcript_36302/g.90356  ORF Transcript_36302/g.90356 Transcript_36302/m.90356 type:complete len:206 (-) Transcript_36302:1306-1923(-)
MLPASLDEAASCSLISARNFACSCSCMRCKIAARADLAPTFDRRGPTSIEHSLISSFGVGRSFTMGARALPCSSSSSEDDIETRLPAFDAEKGAPTFSLSGLSARGRASACLDCSFFARFSDGSSGMSCLPAWIEVINFWKASSPFAELGSCFAPPVVAIRSLESFASFFSALAAAFAAASPARAPRQSPFFAAGFFSGGGSDFL